MAFLQVFASRIGPSQLWLSMRRVVSRFFWSRHIGVIFVRTGNLSNNGMQPTALRAPADADR